MGRRRVLLVGDGPLIAEAAQAIAGHLDSVDVVGAQDSQAAMGQVVYRRPDVIVVDGDLPNWGARLLLEKLRRRPRHARIPVLALCSAVETGYLLRCEGAAEYLVSPVEPDRLAELVESLAAAHDTIA